MRKLRVCLAVAAGIALTGAAGAVAAGPNSGDDAASPISAQNKQANPPRGRSNDNRNNPRSNQRRPSPSARPGNQMCADPNNPRRRIRCSEAPSHFRPVERPPE